MVEVTNRGIPFHDRVAVTREKLKGHFEVKLNKKMKAHKQIETYASEPISFYLHKKRNFFERLDDTKKK